MRVSYSYVNFKIKVFVFWELDKDFKEGNLLLF